MPIERLYLRHIAQELGAMDEFKTLAELAHKGWLSCRQAPLSSTERDLMTTATL